MTSRAPRDRALQRAAAATAGRGAALAVGLLASLLLTAPAAGASTTPPSATAAAASTASPTTTTSDADGTGVEVDLEQIGPTALVPGSQLVVRVRVVNRTTSTVDGIRARLFVDSPVLTDRAAVAAWSAGEGVQGGDRFAGVDGAEQPLTSALAPGASAEVTFTVDADELRLGSDFGPRGVTVDVLGRDLERLDALRTFLVWMPQTAPPATAGFTLLAPVTGGAVDIGTAQLPQTAIDAQTVPGGRLFRLLMATAWPSATLVVDPAVLGPFAQTGSTSATPPTTPAVPTGEASVQSPSSSVDPGAAGGTGPSALLPGEDADTSGATRDWLAQLGGRTSGSVVVLPQGDPDVQGLAAAGSGRLLQLAGAQATSSTTLQLGAAPTTQLVWPADASAAPGPLVLAAAAPAGAASATSSVLVVDAASVSGAVEAGALGTAPATATLTSTASDETPVSARAVLVDGTDSALLATTTTIPLSTTTAAQQTQPNPADAAARLLADTAVAVGGGATGDNLVLALPRTWDPDPAAAAAVLGPVSSAPWVRNEPLADLLAADTEVSALAADPAAAEDPSASALPADSLPADGLSAAESAVTTAEAAAQIFENQQALLDPVERSAVAAASLGWRTQQDAWRSGLGRLSERAAQIRSGVSVVPGSQIVVFDDQVSLPVTVRNSLPQAATVTVELQSNSLRLQPGRAQQLTIPPGAQVTTYPPVRALASGDTSLSVVLRAKDGSLVGERSTLRLRVHAEWEGRGVAIAAVVAVLVLVGGVVRTVLRVRRRPAAPVVRSADQADADAPPRGPQAQSLQPEEPPRG